MTQVISQTGFVADLWSDTEAPLFADYDQGPALFLEADDDPEEVVRHFDNLALIVIPFSSSADGRGFSLAGSLRALGYQGHLRARGHILVDQFRAALSSGFDDIEISDDQAERNPEHQWQSVAIRPGYQTQVFTTRAHP